LNAPIVFSGKAALYPLCAIACGRRPLGESMADVKDLLAASIILVMLLNGRGIWGILTFHLFS
jgi:hypothetical protein